MLSVASLLNPVKPETRGSTRLPSSPSPSICTSSSTHASPQLSTPSTPIKKPKMTKDGAVFAKGKVKGDVNFPPFEHLDEATIRELEKFHVFPVGKMTEYPRHIPYNSEKKSFLEKTGRESFEVFQYVFRVPGDEKVYTVFWDYNIGLVRITPFFKCCKYSKTTPAKMLNLNAGLKDITHSITGGALAAQGYWMPYPCARAILATFCSHISPALIPLFGPSFPSDCAPPEAPEHGRMIIDPSIILSSTLEAKRFRTLYSTLPPSHPNYPHDSNMSAGRSSGSPRDIGREMGREIGRESMGSRIVGGRGMSTTPPSLERRLRLKRTFNTASHSPHTTNSSYHHSSSPPSLGLHNYDTTDTLSETSSSLDTSSSYFHSHSATSTSGTNTDRNSPVTPVSAVSSLSSGGWKTRNLEAVGQNGLMVGGGGGGYVTNPLLSAIPRSTGLENTLTWRGTIGLPPPTTCTSTPPTYYQERLGKRRCVEDMYPHLHSHNQSHGEERNGAGIGEGRAGERESADEKSGSGSERGGSGGTEEKKAAWLLMKLSMKDGERDMEGGGEREGCEGPRVKRRRAMST